MVVIGHKHIIYGWRVFGHLRNCIREARHSWYLNFDVKDCKFWFFVGYLVDGIIKAKMEKRNELSVGNLDS